jgi:very-short-patch-repair endonuclease
VAVRENDSTMDRIRKVFEYLKALNEHRNPSVRHVTDQPWSLWLDKLPEHPSIVLPRRVFSPKHDAGNNEADIGDSPFLLKVGRPKLTPPPSPPDGLLEWLISGWDDPTKPVKHVASRNSRDASGKTIIEEFNDDPARVEQFHKWQDVRNRWKEAELPARAAMGVFEKLYALHGTMEREGERYELVIGDGILSWQQSGGSIYHPVLLQRVQLIFDPTKPAFDVVDADVPTELYTGLFQSIAEVDPRMLRARWDEIKEAGYHPLDQESGGVLQSLVNQLSSQGTFVGEHRPDPSETHPTIGRAAVLFLRSRTKGFGTAIESVLTSLNGRSGFCGALKSIVGEEQAHTPEREDNAPKRRDSVRPQATVLFGKPANPEQAAIAQALDRHGAVLVQGPPGTGKSHTIANLIGHLLANNQSVLVTSHTTKALRVLREHLVEELRPLCVSVLENDLDSRDQLERSVQEISRRLEESAAQVLEREADAVGQQRVEELRKLESLANQLEAATADEYRDIVVGGKGTPPSDAARAVAAGRNEHEWIPGPVANGEPCPLSASEVIELYALNDSSKPEDDQFVDLPLPENDKLPKPEHAERAFQQVARLSESGQIDPRYWQKKQFGLEDVRALPELIKELKAVAEEFSAFDRWTLAVIDAGRAQSVDDSPWHLLLETIDRTVDQVRRSQKTMAVLQPALAAETPIHTQHATVTEILEHFGKGKGLKWWTLVFRPEWKKSLTLWSVKGRQPRTPDDFTAIAQIIEITIARDELQRLWDRLMTVHGACSASELGACPEQSAAQFASRIRISLQWWSDRWLPLEKRLCDLGFQWERFLSDQPPCLKDFGEIRRVIEGIEGGLTGILERTTNSLEAARIKGKLRATEDNLRKFNRPEVQQLRQSLERRDADAYRQSHELCCEARQRRQHAQRRRELLAKLTRVTANGQVVADGWARAIKGRHGQHGNSEVPGDVTKAWEWRQFYEEIARRNQTDLEQLGRDIEVVKTTLHRLTNQLIELRAWSSQLRRTGTKQRQALMGWLSIMKRIGKGFGKRVPELRNEALQQMDKCRDAVPVWIMPLSRLVENFDFSAPRFDVVIIDEASQCDVTALLAFAIARKVVVVGDDKQVSPAAVGQDVGTISHLIRLHLDGIPNAVLYDGKMSIYDLAKQSFLGNICLIEHFRCVPDIIQFSNHLSYDGTIKPLREQASSSLDQCLVPYRVEWGVREGRKVNPTEALAVVSLIVAATQHEAYDDQTFGVISLVGDEQAVEIERLLLSKISPDEYDRRRIVCGNSAQFQGDERDVMFLSMVDSPQSGPLRLSDGDETKQRFNVAASRAKNQTWVVYSLNHEVDLKHGDLRRRLIEHAIDPKVITRELESASARVESPFEQEVLEHLVRRGYRVRSQWAVGHYRIDLVVGDASGRVAIECDGDRFHPPEKIPEDMERQAILERLGWRFIRIRGSDYFRDRDSTMDKVFARVEELGVKPMGGELEDLEDDVVAVAHVSNPVDDVIRHAAELRAQWEEAEKDVGHSIGIGAGKVQLQRKVSG